jgi:hypothetical protein
MNPAGGRGFGAWGWGRGRGGGRGWRNRFYATGWPGWARAGYGFPAWGGPVAPVAGPVQAVPQQELEALKQQAAYFKDALEDIEKRIGELQAQASAQE